MASNTKQSSSEKQETAPSVEKTESPDCRNKQECHSTPKTGDGLDKTEKPEQSEAIQDPKQQGKPDGVAQNCIMDALEESLKPQTLKQDVGRDNPPQNGTIRKPGHSSTSPNKESQSKDNANKRFGPSQRNKSGPRAKNGSYHNYYRRRYNGIHGDDRLPIVRDVVRLQGKNLSLLDVGCNDGTVTIEMASLNRCKEAVGIDIDPKLVGAARKKLRQFIEKQAGKTQAEFENPNIQGPVPKLNEMLPLSLCHSLQLMQEAKGMHKEDGMVPGRTTSFAKFQNNVTFRREDFAQKAPTRTSQEVGKYDVILCLSVTKWVHFAGGDEALKRLFRRLHACLKPGGVLILEPQPQKSYKHAIRKGLGKKDFKGERKLKPSKFAEYLTKTVGFNKMIILRGVRHRGQAFNRPIMSFHKRRTAPPSAVGMALSRHADVFLGVLPSDDDGNGQQQQEAGNAMESQNEPTEQDAEQDGGIRNIVGNSDNADTVEAAGDVAEEGEGKHAKRGNADNEDEVCADRHMQEIDRKEEERRAPERDQVEASRTESGASETRATAKDECLRARNVEMSSEKMSGSPAVVLGSSGLKRRRNTSEEIEEITPQSSKRVKRDLEEGEGQLSLAGPSAAGGNASETKTKAMDNCLLAEEVESSSEKLSGSPTIVLHSSGAEPRSTDKEREGMNSRNRKLAKGDEEQIESEPKLPPDRSID